MNNRMTIYGNLNYRNYSSVLDGLNANIAYFEKAKAYVLSINIAGGAPNFAILARDESGYGVGMNIDYYGTITRFKIDPNSFTAVP